MYGFFSPDVAARIVRATPVIASPLPFRRQREIEQYLRVTNQSGVPWLVVGDQPDEFVAGLN
jgi:hypothetical protein